MYLHNPPPRQCIGTERKKETNKQKDSKKKRDDNNDYISLKTYFEPNS
jgi:hypothetical protein